MLGVIFVVERKQVFVAYNGAIEDKVILLCTELRNAGLKVFMAFTNPGKYFIMQVLISIFSLSLKKVQ